MAIIRKKTDLLPNEVAQYIASNITSNVRELEGRLIKLIASASFAGKDITLDVAKEIFGDAVSQQNQRLTIDVIRNKVAVNYKISPNLLNAHTRKRDVVTPRSVAMYLCKKWTKQSLSTIGLEFGNRDYSTVIHACKKIESAIESDEQMRKRIEELNQQIAPLV